MPTAERFPSKEQIPDITERLEKLRHLLLERIKQDPRYPKHERYVRASFCLTAYKDRICQKEGARRYMEPTLGFVVQDSVDRAFAGAALYLVRVDELKLKFEKEDQLVDAYKRLRPLLPPEIKLNLEHAGSGYKVGLSFFCEDQDLPDVLKAVTAALKGKV